MSGDLSGQRLIIRADADSRMGTGHVMRCLALAQAWQEQGGSVLLAGLIMGDSLKERLVRQQVELHDLGGGGQACDDMSWLTDLQKQQSKEDEWRWLVLDGYHFECDYQRRLRRAGMKLLVIDDYAHLPQYDADLLLNQNAGSERLNYKVPQKTMLLRGSRYALLRREFRDLRRGEKADPAGQAGHILITLGGADPDNVTLKVIESLQQLELPAMQAKIIVGPANPHLAFLQESMQHSGLQAELLTGVHDMVPLMQWADVAITAGGSTCWELAYLGVPSLVITLADNQRGVAEIMAAAGAGLDCGWHHELQPHTLTRLIKELCGDQRQRVAMSRAGRSLVDGQGAVRVVECMMYFPFTFRPAEQEDCRQVFDWANDPVIRQASFHSRGIGWQEHEQWFERTLADRNTHFWIIMLHGHRPAGQVRFVKSGEEAVISISLGVGYRNAGLGSRAIQMACRRLFAMGGISQVSALVKKENAQSVKSFTRAGFERISEEVVHGVPTLKMTLRDMRE
ncbi:MAG: UDP-2,4-diacetamido-2,4,6-trideoxy-beta-L-altropyranose hydrolase [Desulfobulbaceae bacterium]|nr:UDP-2,4-diacetamido-2,4,6-trideoxy-beta-L-altropyranose hydrolase [Desulfobulbaceae bacterium]